MSHDPHHHDHDHAHDHGEHAHGHAHERWDGPGLFRTRPPRKPRSFATRSFTVGIGGPVGSGKTALVLAICKKLRDRMKLGVVTNDIFTREDAEFLNRNEALPGAQIRAVETGGCPHAAIREDVTPNLDALEDLMRSVNPELLIVESGGDKVPRKGGPGVTQSDLLVVNKTDLAPHVGASLEVMKVDGERMRQGGPIVFARANVGEGVDDIIAHVLAARAEALAG